MFGKSKSKSENSVLITHDKPKSTISEKFRGVRSNILFSSVDEPISSIVITSEKPSSGKSTIAANIAVTYAQAGYDTLLIDGDLRKPTTHYIFKKNNTKGLSSLIIKNTTMYEAIQETHVDNLSILTSGPIPPNPSELIGSSNFENLINQLEEKFDFIVIDSPPVNTVTDAQLYAETVENTLLVIDTEENNRNEIVKAKELMQKAGARILGVILNKAPFEKNNSSYYYYAEDDEV
ncbi:polysaccharide biosynthesis tyrosine autokinase [Staphylococcus simulans]|uniref:non-specific protein-tyrosine kinase n=1 Tax=Staphylococcus simulans TaxID=1286 RepID=A0A6N3DRD3_STASI|nr:MULTISPECIES: polysaccharide biosynthesis tyrosine autokinase [Staphylococcus]MBO0387406.1 polysaccharide biosynthesis tyrosine autokinase [Staphylococcus simulans]MBU6942456.1 polysaccharide biosynthesis tyrosine autokinase [Staphylococcus sp. CWZ226]MDQ7115508.1 polysaccharide biosynthesis tyrosine autokinase [Staphylococcus simulans]MDQ7140825.1 polysaccharide biosynthesis tyrosine autokinase [Staphylococcus simulans]RIN54257.1 polysaccharide biosynthesis tyrosine autokinase [Staphylococ